MIMGREHTHAKQFTHHGRLLLAGSRRSAQLREMSASDCGFNWSMQHLNFAEAKKEDVADERSQEASLHRSREILDVGSLVTR
jgi:hypothetical protein